MHIRIGILTISDRASAGAIEDRGGPAVRDALTRPDWEIATETIVPDDRRQIAQILIRWADEEKLDAIFTTGGTGLSPRDITPEATLDIAHRLVPGIAEALRAEGMAQTPMSMLSRGAAVLRGATLIVNLPGSPRGAAQGAGIVADLLEHAIATLRGGDHGP